MPTETAAGRSDDRATALEPHALPKGADPRLGTWRTFLRAHARLTRRLDDELRATHNLSLAEYDALVQLAQAPGRRLRMSVLADRVLLAPSAIPRLVDRLVAAVLVERSPCATDARGAEASLTRAGLDRLRDASTTHLEGVRRYFLDSIDATDRQAIDRGLGQVMDGLDCAPPSALAADLAADA